MHPFKQFFADNGRHPAGDDHICIFVLSDVFPVLEHEAGDADPEFLPVMGFDAALIQRCYDVRHRLPGSITGEDLLDNRCFLRINHKGVLLRINPITKWNNAAVAFTLQGVFLLASADLLGQLCRIVFGVTLQHCFEDDALRSLGDVFLCGNDLDPVFPQQMLVKRAVIAVPGKAVQLPHQDSVEQALLTVSDQTLEFRSVGSSGRQSAVNVAGNDGNAVFDGIVCALPDLALDGLLPLAVRGIACVNDCFHVVYLLRWYCTGFSFSCRMCGAGGQSACPPLNHSVAFLRCSISAKNLG